jgi:hypothetical protein
MKQDGDMSKSGDVPHYGWIEREQRAKADTKKGGETAEESRAALSDEEVEKTVREWRARNLKLEFEEKDWYRDLTVCVVIPAKCAKDS